MLTRKEAAIIGAHTGYLCGPFSDMHEYIEKKLGRPVFTHELASPELSNKIKEVSRDDFMAIIPDDSFTKPQF